MRGVSLVKFKLTIAYEGTGYAGWQWQKTGLGVQQRLEEALAKLFPSKPQVHSSSRTDTGVHAIGMVAHLEIPKAELRMSAAQLPLAINAHLPPDIRVLSARRCRADFHARFHAIGKQYRYFVWNWHSHNPLLRRHAWHVRRPLDLALMRTTAPLFLGQHDFKSVAVNHRYPVESTVRTLSRCEIRKNGPLLTFIIEGDGFLYRMCRGIVGTLVQVGQAKIPPASIPRILDGKDRRLAGVSAPAHGLVLWKVFYPATLPPLTSRLRPHASRVA